MLKFFIFLTWVLPVCVNALDYRAFQGDLFYGKSDEPIFFENEELYRDKDGNFIVGIHRDRFKDIVLKTKTKKYMIRPMKYDWKTEEIKGVPDDRVHLSKENQKRVENENYLIKTARDNKKFQAVPLCFIWPIKGRISSPFGKKRTYNGVEKSYHSGLDIASPKGTEISVIADGEVLLAEKDLFYTGATVIVDHGSGLTSSYSHMTDILVKPGQKIKQGSVVGTVGSTGMSTGPHLHLAIDWNGIRIDPERVLKEMCYE